MSLKSSPDSQTAAQNLPAGLTPELMQWVRDQRASGIGPAALLRSMRDVGWKEELARSALGLPETEQVVCGMALGWEDREAPVNRTRTVREPLERYFSVLR